MYSYKIIGLMSGSSLDGLDIAYCYFEKQNGDWDFSIEKADCIVYNKEWNERLRTAPELDGHSLCQLHTDYGHLLSVMVNDFINANNLQGKVDLIASHGHTVFHFPQKRYTTQIGDGAAVAVGTGITVACDFRTSDIALGGQGTPIVPIGDLLLFKEYNYLLNLGGIANLSIKTADKISAFDICAANQVLNHYALQKGFEYDEGGSLAASGHLSRPMLKALDQLEYYKNPTPKSLDNGFSKEIVIPLIESFEISIEDKLHTYCEHIAQQIGKSIINTETDRDKLFITGGGAFNTFLISRIAAHTALSIHIPFEVNVLSSVTGASRDSCGGALYHP
jgi:anhydro-N-acetylmuramic acid kinase